MSRRRAQALRPQIDQKTADYIDAAIAAAMTEHVYHQHEAVQPKAVAKPSERDEVLHQTLERMAQFHAEIERLKTRADADDRYSLTRAKLIRALKKMGIT